MREQFIENYPTSLIVRFSLFYRIIVIGNYLTSLANEVWFDLQDMGFSDCPCCWPLGRTNRAPVLGRCQGLGRLTRLTFSLGLASGPARLFFKPYKLYINYMLQLLIVIDN